MAGHLIENARIFAAPHLFEMLQEGEILKRC
jgi:hypothetical protein